MKIAQQIGRHIRELHFGPNMPGANLKEKLADLTWEQATTQIADFNPIATLVFHIHYYIRAVLGVMEGGPLDAHDKYSFDVPEITSQAQWEQMLEQVWADAERLALLTEKFPDEDLSQDFVLAKYGSYYRNLNGVIEHSYYHLGRISLLKKMLS